MHRIRLFFLITLAVAACAPRTVTRIDPGQAVDLSGRWNDTDSRAVADEMISTLMASSSFKQYTDSQGKPAIIVGDILNRTSEHIDANNFVKKIEVAIFQSSVADLVESETFRDKLRVERAQQQDFASPETVSEWGKEVGADLMLFGEMTSETDVLNNKRLVNYQVTLFLTDVETNKRVWYGQKEIKKFVRN
ncbi:MAG: penicillin-binding protein activator LpoB [Cyclobacteriaceae bacterium]